MGAEIDAHDAVFRINYPPTEKFEARSRVYVVWCSIYVSGFGTKYWWFEVCRVCVSGL